MTEDIQVYVTEIQAEISVELKLTRDIVVTKYLFLHLNVTGKFHLD